MAGHRFTLQETMGDPEGSTSQRLRRFWNKRRVLFVDEAILRQRLGLFMDDIAIPKPRTKPRAEHVVLSPQ